MMMLFTPRLYSHHVNLAKGFLKVELTARAQREMENSDQTFYVEMQAHAGCMLRKELTFSTEPGAGPFVMVTPELYVGYQFYIGGKTCGTNDNPVGEHRAVNKMGSPRWLRLDYRHGQWSGEFGLTDKKEINTSGLASVFNQISNIFIKPDYSRGNTQ